MLDRIIYLLFFIFYLVCLLFNFDIAYLITVLICAGSFVLVLKVYGRWVK